LGDLKLLKNISALLGATPEEIVVCENWSFCLSPEDIKQNLSEKVYESYFFNLYKKVDLATSFRIPGIADQAGCD